MILHKILLVSMLMLVDVYAKDVQSNIAKSILTAELQGSNGNVRIEINDFIDKIETIGYSTVAANKNIQIHYFNKYQEKNLEMISFFGMVNREKIRPLLLKNPDFGAYAPFNFLVYKTLDIEGDDTTWYGHLDADAMLDIIGEKDTKTREIFHEMIDSFDALVEKEMKPTQTKKLNHTEPLPDIGKMKMVKKFETPDDMEEFVEEFVMDHDGLFSKHDFIIEGFIDFKFEYDNMDLEFEKYDAYWVSLLCHFKLSNSVFNRGIPQAALFAPCSIYFYIPKGTNELHVGYARVDNWINAINIKNQERIDYMHAIDDEVVGILKELGFEVEKEEESKIEKPPTEILLSREVVLLKIKVKELEAELETLRTVRPAASKVVIPVKKVISEKIFKGAKLVLGSPVPKKLTAYYSSNPQSVEVLRKKLEANGFQVLAVDEIFENKTVLTVTNEELQKTNSFVATLHILVNGSDEVRVQNPSYFGAAYLQDVFKYGQFNLTLKALQLVLGEMYEVKDIFELDNLSSYHFMFGMPQLEDTIVVAKGNDIVEKITSDNVKRYISYSLKLPNGKTLVGHKLRTKTYKYLKKIEAGNNAQIFPYEVMIGDSKAVMLNPKYYLALCLPLLSMTDFMKIASAPDEIEKDIKRAYK